jgi:hypothetical protein
MQFLKKSGKCFSLFHSSKMQLQVAPLTPGHFAFYCEDQKSSATIRQISVRYIKIMMHTFVHTYIIHRVEKLIVRTK